MLPSPDTGPWIGFLLFGGFFWFGLFSGHFITRSGSVSRMKDPDSYWFWMALDGVGFFATLCLAIHTTFFAAR